MTWSALASFCVENAPQLAQRTLEHLQLMGWALLTATLVGLPAGIVAARVRWLAAPLITLANIVQTIPSVALLGFLLPFFGIGRGTAVFALFLYALLPIIRNTVTGLGGVPPAVVDAARGMGMSGWQRLWQVELPLARPVIFAGIRTAAVINVGVTTLSALIGAGGLGTFIFRGLATNNQAIILLGAIPAALLALATDALLSAVERAARPRGRVGRSVAAAVLVAAAGWVAWRAWAGNDSRPPLQFGFTAEFMQRPDGYAAWRRHYGLPALASRELDPGLLYRALKTGAVDVACGFSTDGRIAAFGLRVLRDDRDFFPNYDAALLVRHDALERHPEIRALLERLHGAINAPRMRQLNLRVDRDKLTPRQAAAEFLAGWAPGAGIPWDAAQAGAGSDRAPDLVIGTKNFTEQYILGQILCQLIKGATGLHAALKPGLGGTAICFQALRHGDIDLYPEYSGTLLSSVAKPPAEEFGPVAHDPARADAWLRRELAARFQLEWCDPLGFGNTYALLVRGNDPRFAGVQAISDLKPLLPP